MNRARQRFAFNHKTHFGIEHRRARIEIKRADKHLISIDAEGFGMQAGAGIAGQPAVMRHASGVTRRF